MDHIKILPWQNDILPFLSTIDYIILPSLREGSPNIILEGLATKCIPLASNIDENVEIIQNRNLLFNPQSIEEMVRCLIYAHQMSNDEKRDIWEEITSRYTFDWDERIKKLFT